MHLKIHLTYFFWLSCFISAYAAIDLVNYTDVGSNNMSEGIFLRQATVAMFENGNYSAGSGFLLTFSNQSDRIFTGFCISATGDFRIKKVPFEAGIFYRNNPFSEMMREINYGLLLGYGSDHFRLKLGNNFRFYKLNKSTIEENGLRRGSQTRILEPRNLMYSIEYYIMPADHKWNTAALLTNYDFFLINQETNPMIAGRFLYDPGTRLRIYCEIWYQGAGMFNLQANHFGFYLRTGISWQIK
jgi:hypothetical protein